MNTSQGVAVQIMVRLILAIILAGAYTLLTGGDTETFFVVYGAAITGTLLAWSLALWFRVVRYE